MKGRATAFPAMRGRGAAAGALAAILTVALATGCAKQSQEPAGSSTGNPPPSQKNDATENAAGSATTRPPPTSDGGTTASVPEFAVEFRQISKFPTCLSNRRIKVDVHGNVFGAVNESECPRDQRWSTPYPSAPSATLTGEQRGRLFEVIRSSGFLDLDPRYVDEAYEDGSIQEIDVTIAGKTHSVVMDNTNNPAFEKVRRALMTVGATD